MKIVKLDNLTDEDKELIEYCKSETGKGHAKFAVLEMLEMARSLKAKYKELKFELMQTEVERDHYKDYVSRFRKLLEDISKST